MPQHTQRSKAEILFTLAENLGDVFWCVNQSDLSLEYLNPASAEVLGRPLEAFYANPQLWLEIIHPQDRTSIEQSHELLLELGTVSRRYRIVHPDGRVVWMQETAWLISDSDSDLHFLCGIAHDISRKTNGNLTVNEQPMLHRSVFDNTHDAVFVVQVEEDGTFRFVTTNRAHQQKTGLPLAAVSARTPLELVGEDAAQALVANYRRCMAAGSPIEYEERLSLPGGVRDWLTQLVPIRDATGRITHLVGMGRDITRIRDAERVVRKSQDALDDLLDASPVAIYTSHPGPELCFSYMSPGIQRIAGYPRETVCHQAGWWYSAIHPGDRVAHRERVERLLGDGGNIRSRYRLRHAHGHYLWVQDEMRLLRNAAGQPDEIVGALVDISEQHGLYRRLSKLSEQLPGFIYQYQVSPEGHGSFPYASSKSWEIYGVGPETLAVSDGAAVAAVHPDDRARVVESIQYSATSLEPWQCEYRVQHPLGHELWAFGRATPERLEDGTVLWHGYISNITQRKETQFELEASEARYRQIAEHFSDLVCMHDASPEARYRFVSPSALALLGYRPEEMLDRSAYEFIHPDDRQRISDLSHRHVLNGIPDPGIEHRMPHRQGHYLWVESKAMPLLSASGRVIGMQTISRDITQRREAQEAFKALALRQERILEAAGEGIFGIDHQGLINFVNPAASRMLGWERDTIVGLDSHRLFHHTRQDGSHFPAEECLVLQALRTGEEQRSSDEWFWRRDGSGFAVELVASPLLEGSAATGCVVVFQDITERKRSERLLQELSTTDALTGVANRRHFLQRMEQELSRLTRHGGAASLVMFDADRFKKINDTWGHAAGDEMLLGLAATCLSLLRGSDMLGRLGGEEFAVLLPETGGGGGMLFAERLRQAVETLEVPYRDTTLRLTVSLGVTDIRPGESPESILERADRAMYRAKRDGRNRTCSEFSGAGQVASH